MSNFNIEKTRALMSRIVNKEGAPEEIKKDEQHLEAMVQELFQGGRASVTTQGIETFHSLIIQEADKVAERDLTQIMQLIADVEQNGEDDEVFINIPMIEQADFRISVTGGDPQMIRVGDQASRRAQRQEAQVSFNYHTRDLVKNTVATFNKMVRGLADDQINFFWGKIEEVSRTALTDGTLVPTANVLVGSNIQLKDFNKMGRRIARLGGVPTVVGDSLFLGNLAEQQVNLVSDSEKSTIAHNLHVEKIGYANCVPLKNDYSDLENSKTRFDIQTAYMTASGAAGNKPFQIHKFGPMYQKGATRWEDGAVFFTAYFDFSLDLVHTRYFAILKDTSIVL